MAVAAEEAMASRTCGSSTSMNAVPSDMLVQQLDMLPLEAERPYD